MQIPGTYGYVTLHGKGDFEDDKIKDHLAGTNVVTRREAGGSESEKKIRQSKQRLLRLLSQRMCAASKSWEK